MVTLEGSLATNFLLELGLDGVEGEVFPAMLGFELGEGETVLQVSGNLEEVLATVEAAHAGRGASRVAVNLPCSLLHALARCRPHPQVVSSRARTCLVRFCGIPAEFWRFRVSMSQCISNCSCKGRSEV